jgi:hypothetical protein
VAEFIQSISAAIFPFPRNMRRETPRREKSEFSQWLTSKPANANDADAPAMPMLSMEDELMLAKLRELARPFTPTGVYKKNMDAGEALDDNGQYALPFMSDTHVDERI